MCVILSQQGVSHHDHFSPSLSDLLQSLVLFPPQPLLQRRGLPYPRDTNVSHMLTHGVSFGTFFFFFTPRFCLAILPMRADMLSCEHGTFFPMSASHGNKRESESFLYNRLRRFTLQWWRHNTGQHLPFLGVEANSPETN